MIKEMVCVSCPIGCMLTVELNDKNEVLSVKGNTCKRGEQYAVYKGLPFRDAYKATGQLVALCIDMGLTLETLPLEEYKKVCDLFEKDVFEAIDLDVCVKKRTVKGGPSPECVLNEIEALEKILF